MSLKMDILVDPQDQWLLDYFSFHAKKQRNTYYARAYIPGTGLERKQIYLHQAIVGRPLGGLVIDHVNGNGLDNRRSNLNIVTNSANLLKARLRRDNTSGFKGVFVRPRNRNGNMHEQIISICAGKYLGCFSSVLLAHEAYVSYAETLR